jgi:glycosyltransferase involved in cell wall biosynthesis
MAAPTISINIITKDQPEALRKCLDSVYDNLFEENDEVVVVDTGSREEILEDLHKIETEYSGLRFISRPDLAVDFVTPLKRWMPERVEEFLEFYPDGKLITNFGAARQVAQDASKKDLIFWIDTDDVLVDPVPGQFRAAINNLMDTEDPKADAIFLDYQYAFDEADQACITTLRRERVYWRDRYHWAGRCHETALPNDDITPRPVAFMEALKTYIKHTDARKPGQFSDMRNYVILRDELEASEVPDPRTIFYLGNACRGLGLYREAVSLYRRFDRISGSEDDRFNAWYFCASIFMEASVRRPHDAYDCFLDCMKIKPNDPRPYYGLARATAAMKRSQESLEWYEKGLTKRIPETQMHSHDPTHVNYHPHCVACICYKDLDNHEKAVECAARAYQARPQYQPAEDILKSAQNFHAAMTLTQSVGVIFGNLQNGGPNAERVAREICAELRAIPPELEKRGVSRVEPPDPRPCAVQYCTDDRGMEGPVYMKPKVAFWCGNTHHEWSYKSREDGIGGSEKMVILVSEALQRRGINVSVYCNCPSWDRGIDEKTGVLWRHWAEFDKKRDRDVVVFWRNPEACVGIECPAKKRIVWNHDVQNRGRYTEEVLAAVDYIQFQSDAHLDGVRDLPEEKIWVARNAVEVPDQWPAVPDEKKPKLVAYCSSPDRGLLTAAEVVARAQAIDPEIRLLVTYGFPDWARKIWAENRHPTIPDLGLQASIDQYERDVYRMLDRIQAQVLHKVGFDEMENVWRQCGVWLYPTRFLEISCMAAMEAQLFGCIPVATTHHALAETILPEARVWDNILETPPMGLEKYDAWLDVAAKKLVAACNVPGDDAKRVHMAGAAAGAYTIEDLATQWIDKLDLGGDKAIVAAAESEKAPACCASPEDSKGED